MILPKIRGINGITQITPQQVDGEKREIPVAVGVDEDGTLCLILDGPNVISSADCSTVIALLGPVQP